MNDKFKEFLNQEQYDIVKARSPINLIFAGAGTGKTRTLLYKIYYLLIEDQPEFHNFFITTFTNKAAGELRERISQQLNEKVYFPWLGTFHSLCSRILRKYASHLGFSETFTIYDEDDSVRLLKRIIPKDKQKEDKPERILKKISVFKENYHETGEVIDSDIEKYYRTYEKELRNSDAMDFSDLLEKTIVLFEKEPGILNEFTRSIKYVFVDEFQDTNLAQLRILKLLWKGLLFNDNSPMLFVVGDENQSIYGFRNAKVENILNFPQYFKGSRIFTLKKNYRSTAQILDVAAHLAFDNPYKTGKLEPADPHRGGERVRYAILKNDRAEAEYIVDRVQNVNAEGVDFSDIAVFFRTNFQVRILETYFRDHGIPYVVVGAQKFYERKEIRDIIAYIKLVLNDKDTVNLNRVINIPRRGLGKKTVDNFNAEISRRELPFSAAAEELLAENAFSARQAQGIRSLLDVMKEIREMISSPSEALMRLVEMLDYFDYLKDFDDEGYEDRIDNVNYLIREIQHLEDEGFETLHEIMEILTLSSSVDSWKQEKGAVNLMTLHLSKGLEFDTVFITGVEQGILPHSNSQHPEQFKEEQRLLYVGITRGKNRVFLTRAKERFRFGEFVKNSESEFIQMIPREQMRYEDKTYSKRWTTESLFRGRGEVDKSRPKTSLPKEITYVPDLSPTTGNPFKKGIKVRHPDYGVGMVISSHVAGSRIKVDVRFYKYGKKVMIGEFLEIVG